MSLHICLPGRQAIRDVAPHDADAQGPVLGIHIGIPVETHQFTRLISCFCHPIEKHMLLLQIKRIKHHFHQGSGKQIDLKLQICL